MTINIKHVHVRSADQLDSTIEYKMFALAGRMEIEEALVRLEYEREGSPAFLVQMELITPGPDLYVEARDHTLQAALGKALQALEEKVDRKITRRTERLLKKLQAPPNAPNGRMH